MNPVKRASDNRTKPFSTNTDRQEMVSRTKLRRETHNKIRLVPSANKDKEQKLELHPVCIPLVQLIFNKEPK